MVAKSNKLLIERLVESGLLDNNEPNPIHEKFETKASEIELRLLKNDHRLLKDLIIKLKEGNHCSIFGDELIDECLENLKF